MGQRSAAGTPAEKTVYTNIRQSLCDAEKIKDVEPAINSLGKKEPINPSPSGKWTGTEHRQRHN